MSPRRLARLAALLAVCLPALSACATLREFAHEMPARVTAATKPVKYAIAGAEPARRDSLERAQQHLKAGEHRLALAALRHALWDAERIDARWLRLEELTETHRALAAVYDGLRRPDWADEHRALALALAQYPGPDTPSSPDRAFARGKRAYRAARFREAVFALIVAQVELQGVADTRARVASLQEARCFLLLSRFALDQEERAREEVRRLAALDDSIASCRRHAPPTVQAFIRSVQVSDAPAARRSP